MMMEEIEKGSSNNKNNKSLSLKRVHNYNLEGGVAKYDKTLVISRLKSLGNNKLASFFNFKYFSESLFGKTWHILLFYLVIYYTIQTLYQLKYLTAFCTNHMFDDPHNHTQECNQMIVNWFTHWREYDKMMLSCITFFLGFFVNHTVKRWWDQITKVPTIEPVVIGLAGLVWPSKHPNGGGKSVTIFRKTILRYCLLSYAMAFRKFSNLRNHLYDKEDFIKKELLTSNECSILSNNNGCGEIWWVDRWWIPLAWPRIWLMKHLMKRKSYQKIIRIC